MSSANPSTVTQSNIKFVARVTLIHVVTYILCGMVFSLLFDYKELFTLGNTKYFMRPVDSSASLIGPAVQVVRGVLFGLVLLLFRNCYQGKKYAWLRLWTIIVIIGILNTHGSRSLRLSNIKDPILPTTNVFSRQQNPYNAFS